MTLLLETMNLKSLLEETVTRTESHRTEQEIENESVRIECEVFNKFYGEASEDQYNTDSTDAIPRFYFKIPRDNEKLAVKLREESRATFLQRRSRGLLDSNELNSLWVLLDKHHSPPYYADEQFINYNDFLKVATLAGEFHIMSKVT